jgi:hypothetical protein
LRRFVVKAFPNQEEKLPVNRSSRSNWKSVFREAALKAAKEEGPQKVLDYAFRTVISRRALCKRLHALFILK